MNTCVACDSEILQVFRKAVLHHHGKLHGVLKIEVNKALLNHINKLKKEIDTDAETEYRSEDNIP